MTFSEFFLAYKIAISRQVNIISMDRSVSNMYFRLIYNTSKKKSWNSNCSILNYEIEGHKIDINDLTLARHNLINESLSLPPPRGDYIRYLIFFKILKDERLNLESICHILDIEDRKKIKRIEKLLEKWIDENVIVKIDGYYHINDKYKSTWDRIKQLVNILGDQIFQRERDPFIIVKNLNEQK